VQLGGHVAGFLGRREQVTNHLFVHPGALLDGPQQLASEVLPLAEEDTDLFHVAQVPLDVELDERMDALDRPPIELPRLFEDFTPLLMDILDDPPEQVFLGLDVVIQAALEDANLLSDIRDRSGAVTLLPEDLDRGLRYLGLAVRLLGRARRGSSCLAS